MSKARKACPSCTFALPPGNPEYCPHCGTRLSPVSPGAPEPTDTKRARPSVERASALPAVVALPSDVLDVELDDEEPPPGAVAPSPKPKNVSKEYAGRRCPYCHFTLKYGERMIVCPACGATIHEDCWKENHGCTTYGCRYALQFGSRITPGLPLPSQLPSTLSTEDLQDGPNWIRVIAYCQQTAEPFSMWVRRVPATPPQQPRDQAKRKSLLRRVMQALAAAWSQAPQAQWKYRILFCEQLPEKSKAAALAAHLPEFKGCPDGAFSCPHCHAKSFFKCSKCEALVCFVGGQGVLVRCPRCGHSGHTAGYIQSFRGAAKK